MVQKLQQLQLGLSTNLQTDSALQNKIIVAYKDVKACQIALTQPVTIFTGLTNNIFLALCSYTKVIKANKLELISSSNFIMDRQYHP